MRSGGNALRRAKAASARSCGARVFYVRCTSARMTRGITAKSAPKSAQICVPARNFFKFFKKFSFSVQRTGTKYRVYNIRTLLCTSKCSASRAFLRPHTQNSHPIPCKPVNIRKPAHGLKQIRSEMCKFRARFRASRIRYMQSRARP